MSTATVFSWCHAGHAIDAIEAWATNCFLLRETAAIRDGRIDGLLVPTGWDSPCPTGFLGIEVKVQRSDFLRGLRSGQFERYDGVVNGLYVATPHGVCKTKEVPPGIGHLVVTRRHGYGPVCVCKRHPSIRERPVDEKLIWRVIFDLFDQFRRDQWDERQKLYKTCEIVRDAIFEKMMKAVDSIEKRQALLIPRLTPPAPHSTLTPATKSLPR